MAKNNFKAKEATDSANYAQNIGTMGQGAMGTGLQQQQQGFQNLQDTFQGQKSFAQMLQDAAAGKGGPSLADQQILDATARNNANAAGFAAGAKGLNPALAARQALMAQAGNNQQAAGQAAQTRIQEQQAARAQLGGALAGQAGTAGGMTSAGSGLFGTGGQLANQSNANLIQSRSGANQINADVAKQNAGAINGMIGGVMNAAGGAFGLAEGGVVPGEPEGTQSPETEIALAYGGGVPREPSLPSTVRSPAQPRRSFAAQVAHHLAREYFDEGGEAGHTPYHFDPMDLRHVKPQKPKSEGGADTTMFIPHDYHPSQPSDAQREGQDSEGREKPSINRAFGGEAEHEYDPYDDDPEADNEPDTDSAFDEGEADEPGHNYAAGGDVGDESAGLDTSKTPEQVVADHTPATPGKVKPTGLQRAGAALSAFGSSMGGGPAAFKLSDLQDRQPQHPATAAVPSSFQAPAQPAVPAPAAPQPVTYQAADQRNYADGGTAQSAEKTAARNAVVTDPSKPHGQETYAGSGQYFPAGGEGLGRTWGSRGGKPLRTTIPVKEPGQKAAVAQFKQGGPVPGQAPVAGNSLKNDVVDAKLSPGEVVLPRTISHNPKAAKRFVELLQDGHDGHSALAAIKGKRS